MRACDGKWMRVHLSACVRVRACVRACACVCVCVSERPRERQRQRQRDGCLVASIRN